MTRKRIEAPHTVDIQVGNRLRLLRKARGLSQREVAEVIGVTYQQIQKYETAASRLAPSTLAEIAHHFGVPTSFFLDGLDFPPGRARAERPVLDLLRSSEGAVLANAFLRLPEGAPRSQALELIFALAPK